MTAILKYTCIDTPIDFAKFLANSFSVNQINQSKNLSDRVNLVATAVNFAEIMGYTHEGMKKVVDNIKAFKIVSGAVSFIPAAIDTPPVMTVSAVADYAKSFFGNGTAFLMLLDKCNHPVSAASVKTMSGIGAAAGGISAAIGLTKDVAQLERSIAMPSSYFRNLHILSSAWGILQKITLIAASAILFTTSVAASFVAVPVIPGVVMPSLLMSAAVFGLFNRYVAQYATRGLQAV